MSFFGSHVTKIVEKSIKVTYISCLNLEVLVINKSSLIWERLHYSVPKLPLSISVLYKIQRQSTQNYIKFTINNSTLCNLKGGGFDIFSTISLHLPMANSIYRSDIVIFFWREGALCPNERKRQMYIYNYIFHL